MAEKNKQNKKDEEIKPRKGYSFLAVWSVPVASKPILRLELKVKVIQAKEVLKIVCDAIGMYKESRKFFALFRGALYPLKKYGNEESIMLPYKATLTLQKWCFDVTAERIAIKTDEVAFRLIANQTIADIENGKLQATDEELEPLKQFYKGQFVCYKQLVDKARDLPYYCTLMVRNVEVVNKALFVSTTIDEGTKLDIIVTFKKLYLISDKARDLPYYCTLMVRNVEVVNKALFVSTTIDEGTKLDIIVTFKKLHLISDSIEFGIPWRKIRWFTEKKDRKVIALEVFRADDKSFTWIELCTPQFTLLLQAIAECIDLLQARVEKPLFTQPLFVQQKRRNKLTWGLVKTELFGIGRKKEEVFATFDSFDNPESSSDENESVSSDDDEEEDEKEEERGSRASYSRFSMR